MTIRDWLKKQKPPMLILLAGLALGSFAYLLLLAVYAYQGTFTRYMADDYCNAVLFSRDVIGGLALRYTSGWGGNRYSNIWLVGLSEILGPESVRVLPPSLLLLWAIGLLWMMSEIKKAVKMDWPLVMTAFLGLSIAFFSLLQAPNRYQTVYWRSSMTTHFAPVVSETFLLAYLLKQGRRASVGTLPRKAFLIVLVSAFLIGGFSEPSDAIQVAALVLAILGVWRWVQGTIRNRLLTLLAWALAGALLSLIVMIVSPANSNRLGEPPGFVELAATTVLYSYIFIMDTFRMLPLPTALSMLIPALLFWSYGQAYLNQLSTPQKRGLWFVILAAPVIMYLLIAASFSPSVYGQGYPVARMRFAARLVMSICLLLEGSLLGILLAQIHTRSNRLFWQGVPAVLFTAVSILYPFRAVWQAYREIPAYRERAALWDARDAFIRRHVARGETDIVAPGLSGVDGVKELDVRETHWVNRCAAHYYGANTIRAIPVPDEFMDDVLND